MEKPINEKINTCPFLGLGDDNTSHMAFASPGNYCHHCKPIVQIKLEHQSSYCLDSNFVNCPAYVGEAGRRMPPELIYKEALNRSTLANKFLPWAGLIIVGIVVAILLFFLSRNKQLSENPPPIPTGINSFQTLTAIANISFPDDTSTPKGIDSITPPTSTETALPSVTATVSPFPSLTLPVTASDVTETNTAIITPHAPTSTSTPSSPHSLDVPIGRGQLFVIHRVMDGENLSTLADTYETSLDAILAVNYLFNVPIRIDAVVVIPLKNKDPQGMPIFEPYQVQQDQISAEALAEELQTDPLLFKYINTLKDGEMLRQGDWFLIPRQKQE